MQKTTYLLGRLIVNIPFNATGAGVQDSITSTIQNVRSVFMYAFIILIFGLTTYCYAWYHGLWVVVVCFINSSIITAIFRLYPGSTYLVNLILKDLKSSKQRYHNRGDNMRSEMIGDLIEKIGKLSQERIKEEAIKLGVEV